MTPLPSLADLFPPYAIQVEVAVAAAVIVAWTVLLIRIKMK
jgi:hypothetical protein